MKEEVVFFKRSVVVPDTTTLPNFASIGSKVLNDLLSGRYVKGRSFIRNLTGLFYSKATSTEKGLYIYLASLRNHMDVLLYEDYTLNRILVPEISDMMLVKNRLILVENGKINFYYEDKTNGY